MAPAYIGTGKKSGGSTKRIHETRTTATGPCKSTAETRSGPELELVRSKPLRKSAVYSLLFKIYCLSGGPLLNSKEVMVLFLLGALLLALTAMGSYKQLLKLVAVLTAA